MFEALPQELKFDALWCAWKLTERGKVPFDAVSGLFAKSNDKGTFHCYKTVLNYLGNYYKVVDGKMIGGLGLGIFKGFSAIDIDNCIDENGTISDLAQEIIDYCQSYTEKSPSGKGIRIIFKTDVKELDKNCYYINNRKIGLEIYIEGITSKFVTITGNCILNANVNKIDILPILNKFMKKEQATNIIIPNTMKTAEITRFLTSDLKLKELWENKAPGGGANESELDLALCCKLAFYTGCNQSEMKRLFESSPYFSTKDDKHIKKWNTEYSINTIQKAINGCTAVYNPNYQVKHYDANDTGNAHRFIDKFGLDIRYNVDNKSWMQWNGSHWQVDYFNNVKNLAEELIDEMKIEAFTSGDKEKLRNVNHLLNKSGKENMISEAQHLPTIPVCNDMFDKDDYLFNCQNGVINLKTGALLEHNKNLLLNKIGSCMITKNEPKLFLKFLNDMFQGNQELIDYLQKAFGYSLTGDCREQCMFILQGDGNDGKSLLLQVIQEVIGDYSATSNPDLLLDKKTQSQNLSEVARLKGIRYCVVNELKMGDKLNESGVKDITSGNNKIVARFLYGNEFEFLPKMKIWLATNYEPKIIGTDKGIWRRIVKIPCKRSLKDNEVDKDLIYKLRNEYSDILGWLLDGCIKWQKEGLEKPKILVDELNEYRTEMDIIQRWINECCELNNSFITKSSDLFDNFKNYCVKNNEFPMSQTLFGRNFSKKFEKVNRSGYIVYIGVRIKSCI